MKKQIFKALTLIFALALIFALPMSAEDYKTGDMNGDGVVNTDDAIYLLRHVLNKEQYELACNHNLTSHKAKAATCTEGGWEAYETCSRCNYNTYKEIPALGHDEIAVQEKAATCTDIGYTTHVICSRCDYKVGYSEISAKGHNYKNGKCTGCGENYPDFIQYSEGLKFTSNGDGTCYVSGIGTCTDTDVVIPTISPAGNSVTSIGDYAFYGCSKLTSITFKDTSTWYRTTNSSNWQNKTGGTQTSVTNSSTNATYFTSNYYNYYWYKK